MCFQCICVCISFYFIINIVYYIQLIPSVIYLHFYYYHLVDTSAGGQSVPEGIIRLVVSASVLTWFIRYIFYWNLQFINNVIINKTMVLIPHVYVTLANFGYPV